MRFVRRLLHCGLEAVVSLAGNMAGLRTFRVTSPDRGRLWPGSCPPDVEAPSRYCLASVPLLSRPRPREG